MKLKLPKYKLANHFLAAISVVLYPECLKSSIVSINFLLEFCANYAAKFTNSESTAITVFTEL